MAKNKIVIVSGYFDPLHVGHIHCFKEARKLGDVLFVIVNTDEQTMNKKGYVFMPSKERLEIINELNVVERAILSVDKDATVCKTLQYAVKDITQKLLFINRKGTEFIFANGGDRVKENVPEGEICKELGIEMVFGVGGDKIQSSSELVKRASSA